ncbi:amidohydrolase family protein [Mycolicibacterium sp.]|uniref:amidohydrolase family protein n=1 Tax=Mycolicibacterium sp. TaxID=2320850 RepID=UPI0037C9A5FF
MLIQHATMLDGAVVDIRVGDRIEQIADTLAARPGEDVLDAGFGTVIPGLHDHHMHVYSAAAEKDSVRIHATEVHGREELARILTAAVPGADGWIRAVGYHESVAGPLDRETLDAVTPPHPVRVQDRSGVLWTLNSAGLAAIGQPEHPDGRLRSADPSWQETLPRRQTRLAAFSDLLCGYGVTGVTDATPGGDVPITGLRQRVHVLGSGKKILHDDDLDLDALTRWIADRHHAGRSVAVHCVTTAQLVVTMAALRTAGTAPGDRIEHAAMAPGDCLSDLVGLGVTVVTQPNFVAERGDEYRTDVPADEHDQLWRVASLLRAGVPVALSTDAPFGDSDPWAAMRAAVHRRTPSGVVLGPAERILPRTALTLFLGGAVHPARPRRIAPGQPGDLCVLSAPPGTVLAELDAGLVAATIVGGRVVFRR